MIKENNLKVELFDKAVILAKNARKMGMKDADIAKMFREKNWSEEDINNILEISR
jgi:hypothetical protein